MSGFENKGPLSNKLAFIVGEGELAATVGERLNQAGARTVVSGDPSGLTRPDTVDAFVAETERAHGPIDILVHLWDVAEERPAADIDPETWRSSVQTGIKSRFLFAQAAGRSMLERGRGNQIFLTSVAGLVGFAGSAIQAASHGALHQIVRTLGVEWAGRGVRVNAVAATLLADSRHAALVAGRSPIKRLANADDVAGAIVYLASDDAAMATGQIMTIDGGYVTQ